MIYQNLLNHYKSNKKHHLSLLKGLKKIPGRELDEQFEGRHEEVFREVDCLKCANCCKTISPIFKAKDINRIAKSMNLKPTNFIDKYLYLDNDGDYVLNQTPCPFLGSDNYCSIYDVRPTACSEFPHTNHKNMQKHLHLTKKNLDVCPAVVEIVRRFENAGQ